MLRVFVAGAVIAGSLIAASAASAQTISPNRVAIVGSDYAFPNAPTTLPAGETLFSFENRGTVRHEVNIRLLKPGVTPQEAMRAFVEQGSAVAPGSPPPPVIERNVAILIAQPGDTSGGRIYVRLIPGRSYALVCVLRDKPGAPPHTMLGMLAGFTVPQAKR